MKFQKRNSEKNEKRVSRMKESKRNMGKEEGEGSTYRENEFRNCKTDVSKGTLDH